MIGELKPYGEYKESGLSWLGRVPGHWALRRMKSAVTNVVDQTSDMEPDQVYVALEHVESWTGRARPQRDCGLFTGHVKRFREGDVLFGKLRPYLAKVTRIAGPGVCAGEFFVLRPTDPDVTSSYLEHLLRAKQTIDVIDGSTFGAKMPRADWQFCGSLPLPLPPPAEQAAIVRFLDWANGRLERAIRAKRKVIALLGEQKQAIIHRAVTRGLDPNVRLKSSCVEWLGDVPEHWEVVILGRGLTSIGQGWSPVAAEGHILPDQWAVLSLSSVRRGRFNPDAIKPVPESAKVPSGIEVFDGDLLLTRSNTRELVGDVCIVAGVRPRTVMCDLIYRLIPDGRRFESTFLMYQLLSRVGRRQIEQDARGSSGTMPKVSQRQIRSWRVLRPPLDEQRRISAYIISQLERVDAAIDSTQRKIDLLREYRTRLVADVVTGKLDVREAAARLPDEAPPESIEDDPDPGDDDEAAEEDTAE